MSSSGRTALAGVLGSLALLALSACPVNNITIVNENENRAAQAAAVQASPAQASPATTARPEALRAADAPKPPVPPETPHPASKAPAASGAAFSESYALPNGFLTAHYPADFLASTHGTNRVVVRRNLERGVYLSEGEHELVSLIARPDPPHDDVHELARFFVHVDEKGTVEKNGTWTTTAERDTECLGKYRGVEIEATFTLPGAGEYQTKRCVFLHEGRGYELYFEVPRARAGDEAPLLARIVAATEIAP